MKKIFFIGLFALCLTGVGFAQESRTVILKRTVEKNKRPHSKKAYSFMLLDAVNGTDAVYSEYEDLVQAVWDKESDADIAQLTSIYLGYIDEYRNMVTKSRIYVGGDAYRAATLDYIDAVRVRIAVLKEFGILGKDPNSDFDLYKTAAMDFNDATNTTILRRNDIRTQKGIYDTTFYIEK